MKPAEFSVGERIYQGASTTSYTAYGFIKNWDNSGRVVSVEIVEGEFIKECNKIKCLYDNFINN